MTPTMPRQEAPRPERPELTLVFPVCDEVENLGLLIDNALSIAGRLAARSEALPSVASPVRRGAAACCEACCAASRTSRR